MRIGRVLPFRKMTSLCNRVGITLIFCTFCLYIVFVLFVLKEREHFQFSNLYETQTNVTILMWTTFYSSRDNLIPELRKAAPLPSWCHLTFDRKVLEQSQAVIFHVPGVELDMNDLPETRKSDQVWVFLSLESPAYMIADMRQWNKLEFNRTMTYRLDSDFPIPYGFVTKRQHKATNWAPDIRNKTKLAVWMASHCGVKSKRDKLVYELQKHMPVDTYGSCGTKTCEPGNEMGCYEILGRKYKFYLAFENSVCTDYITEKFSNALYANMVPVVYGGGDYEKILPEKAYIDVNDFENITELAKYLISLDQNEGEYLQYFRWRKYFDIHIKQGLNGFRLLCHAIKNGLQAKPRTYPNIKEWWADEKCQDGAQWPQ